MEFLRPKRASLSLDMTPMIDIVFQLLIFFMLTSSFLTPALKLTLPKSVSRDAAQQERLVISIEKQGGIYVNTQKVPLEQLKIYLEEKLGNSPQPVHLRGDAEMPYKLFVQVMDLARQAGASQIHIMHEPGGAG